MKEVSKDPWEFEVQAGDFITINHWKDPFTTACMGSVLLVHCVMVPFIVVEPISTVEQIEASRNRIIIDVRRVELMPVTPEYIEALCPGYLNQYAKKKYGPIS